MSDEEIRIAVAEACGVCIPQWTFNGAGQRCTKCNRVDYHTQWSEMHPGIPNYPNDLNDCREMEKSLTPHQCRWFQEHLSRIVFKQCTDADWSEGGGRAATYVWHATARQRCEAFLRTIGKWKDNQ